MPERAQGAVTLSIMLTLPYLTADGTAFPQRSLLIFMASGVILLTLLLANFIVPVLAPAEETSEVDAALPGPACRSCRTVIDELAERATPETRAATRLAIRSYRERLDSVLKVEASAETVRDLRVRVIDEQIAFVSRQAAEGRADAELAERYAAALEQLRGAYGLHHGVSGGRARRRAHVMRVSRALRGQAGEERRHVLAELHRAGEKHAVDALAAMGNELTDGQRRAARMIAGGTARLAMSLSGGYGEGARLRQRIREQARDIEAEGLGLELEQIRRLHDAGHLSTRAARELREEIYLLQMGLDAR